MFPDSDQKYDTRRNLELGQRVFKKIDSHCIITMTFRVDMV